MKTNTNPIASDESGCSGNEEERTVSQSLYALIAEQPFFKGMDARQLQLLTDSAREVHFAPGDRIFEEGSPANRFYLILEGKVAVESQAEEHGMVLIQTLGPGADLGWSWLFPPYYLRFSAYVLEPTRAIFFYGKRLREDCEQNNDLGYELMKRIAQVVAQRLQATQRRLVECFAGSEMMAEKKATPTNKEK